MTTELNSRLDLTREKYKTFKGLIFLKFIEFRLINFNILKVAISLL